MSKRFHRRTVAWWVAAILSPIGILGGPIAGADLVSGVIEWKGIVPYLLAYWDIYVSGPLSRIAAAMAAFLGLPSLPEIVIDYLILCLLLLASFVRARNLNAPSAILKELQEVALQRAAPSYTYVEPASLSPRQIDKDPRDVVLMGRSSDGNIRLGNKTAGAVDAIHKEFEAKTTHGFFLLCLCGSIVWPLAIVFCSVMILRDLVAAHFLARSHSTGLFSMAARRVAIAEDAALTEGMISLLRERSVRTALAIAPFILFVLLCLINIAANQATVHWPNLLDSKRQLEIGVTVTGFLVFLGLATLLFRKSATANENKIIGALERARDTIAIDIKRGLVGGSNAE